MQAYPLAINYFYNYIMLPHMIPNYKNIPPLHNKTPGGYPGVPAFWSFIKYF